MTKGRKLSIAAIFVAGGLVVAESIKLKRQEKEMELVGKAEPLNSAIFAGDIKKIQTLISEDKSILRATGVKSSTPLNAAIWQGRLDIVDLLVTNGAPINSTDEFGLSALHCAVGKGDRAMAEYFLSRGADINAKAGGDVTPLHMAVNSRKRDVVELLVLKGADLNAKSITPEFAGPNLDERFTPLQWALRIGEKEIAEFLRKSAARQ